MQTIQNISIPLDTIDKKCRAKLTVPELPFSEIDRLGAGMYKGERIEQAVRHAIKTESQRDNTDKSTK